MRPAESVAPHNRHQPGCLSAGTSDTPFRISRGEIMSSMVGAGMILTNEALRLPTTLQLESEPYVPGWRLIKNLDGDGVGRKILEAGWTFFCLAGEIKATVVGSEGQKTLRRAVKQIL